LRLCDKFGKTRIEIAWLLAATQTAPVMRPRIAQRAIDRIQPLSMLLKFAMKLIAACAGIHWSGGIFNA